MHPYQIRDVVGWPFLSLLMASVPRYGSKKKENTTEGDYQTVDDEIAALKKFGL